MTIGQWISGITSLPASKIGQPATASTKSRYLSGMRTFFRDAQEWGWISRHFDPMRVFATPTSLVKLIGPKPRVIADDIWAKLLTAGLNLKEEDLPAHTFQKGKSHPRTHVYPLAMVQAIVVVWLFSGLRRDEIRRLRLGCIRWQTNSQSSGKKGENVPDDAVCFLDVPVNKTTSSFTKPVDRVVGEAIALWEKVRPQQPMMLDRKTGEMVQFLFAYRGRMTGKEYINVSLIPALCRKAGVPESDVRGDITSHRARSTIASQLFNAKEPMSLFELQAWLGHSSPHTTQFYANVTPTKLAQAYAETDYFKRNVRTITVLIDRESIKSGTASQGSPWRYFDLGHGYCSYEFFEQCPHRIACAKCPFYLPKDSTQMLMKEAQGNLVRMKQEMELSDEEIAAIDEGVSLMGQPCSQLADIPTPGGPTPRQLRDGEPTK
jgi:integrase